MWITPPDALARHRSGEIDLIVPTVRTLQTLTRFGSAPELLAAAAARRAVPTVEPRVVADADGLRLVQPGEPGYELPSLSGPVEPAMLGELNDAIRDASLRTNLEGPVGAPGPYPGPDST